VTEENREFKAQKVIKVHRVHWVIRECRVLKVRRETEEIMVSKDCKVSKDQKVIKVSKGIKENKGFKACKD
jgi:hypothetical protein